MKAILIFLIMIPITSFAQITKDVCKTFNDEFSDINSQLPMQVDYATQLIGLNSMFTNNSCFIHYEYLVNESVFLDSTKKSLAKNNIHVSSQELISFYQTNKGHDRLQKDFKRMQLKRLHGNKGMENFLKYKGVITVTSAFSGEIPNLTLTIKDD